MVITKGMRRTWAARHADAPKRLPVCACTRSRPGSRTSCQGSSAERRFPPTEMARSRCSSEIPHTGRTEWNRRTVWPASVNGSRAVGSLRRGQ
ncbi:MAG: hypothetical protein AMXMBFR64_35120 [Myxococcales bacterium]